LISPLARQKKERELGYIQIEQNAGKMPALRNCRLKAAIPAKQAASHGGRKPVGRYETG
jgi:hypothetical protein